MSMGYRNCGNQHSRAEWGAQSLLTRLGAGVGFGDGRKPASHRTKPGTKWNEEHCSCREDSVASGVASVSATVPQPKWGLQPLLLHQELKYDSPGGPIRALSCACSSFCSHT
ncbi:hypothetical protein VTL71DRAFT_14513, partial [Oculimacula yallundae]